MNEYEKLRNMTEKERYAHEAAMGYPSRQTFNKQDLGFMKNAYVPTVTEEAIKIIHRKWWQFWK